MRNGWSNHVLISISGSETERFLNIVSFHGLVLYQVRRKPSGIEADVKAKDFLKLCCLRTKADVSIRILEKRGPYFLWKKTRKSRVGICCGILAFAALYVMSLFVWDIDFAGNMRYTDSYLLQFVKNEGYKPGMKISSVACDRLEKRLRNEFDDITWVSARLEGTRLVVEIEENNTASAKEKEQTPCSLKASKSGIIARIITRRGTPLVKKGDQVEKGDLLVSGLLPIYNDSQEIVGYEKTNASADVWIKYEENIEITIPRSQTVRHYTSKQVHSGIVLFGHRFCLPQSLMASDQEELYIEQHQWKLFEHFYLPFYNEEYCLMKYENATVCYDDESLKKQADQKYLEFIIQLEKLGVEIIENNVTIESGPKDYRMNVQFLLEANASEKCTLESQVQELQKQE